MKNLFVFLVCSLITACVSTVDFDKTVSESGVGPHNAGSDEDNVQPLIPGQVVIERPVYVPAQEKPPPKPQPGMPSVSASNNDGIIKPENYSHAAMLYDYNPNFVYEVFAQPLRVCDIVLQQGEKAVEPPFVSDSERWILGAGVSYDNGIPVQHIYVKPISAGLDASLIINTDVRVYHIILRSYTSTHMPIVRWKYGASVPNNYIMPQRRDTAASDDSLSSIDPRYLSFNYRMSYGLFSKPYWLPSLAFDDGSKTFITFPDMVLQRELPTVFENRNDVLNYRVAGNLIIIDKLIQSITVRIGRTEIAITKKKGGSK